MNNASLKDAFAYDKTFDCVQCGYCLLVRPYETMGKATHSPRGRINLMKLGVQREGQAETVEALHLVDPLMEAGPHSRI